MHAPPALTLDEIDDLLYFVRVNEPSDLQQTVTELGQKYQCSAKDVVEAGVNPESGNTMLHYCAANGFSDLLPKLLAYLDIMSAPNTSNGKAPVPTAINRANKEGNTPLHWGAYNGQLAIVKQLVEAGADMWIKNTAGHLAMFEAERADKGEVVQYLLEAGGKEVEQTGQEGHPSEEDVADVQNGGTDNGSNGQALPSPNADVR